MEAEARQKFLVGRTEALRSLREALEAHRSQARGALVAVGAAAGMGKTTLVESFAAEASSMRLLRIRCAAGQVPFSPLIELEKALRPPLVGVHSASPEHAGGPRFATALLERHLADARSEGPGTIPPHTLRTRATALVNGFIELANESVAPIDQPARVILFEQLHAADDDTLYVLRKLTCPPYPLKAMIVATYREESASDELKRLIHRIDALSARDGRFVHIRLGPLSGEDARRLLVARYPGVESHTENLGRLVDLCEGHPERLERACVALEASGALKMGKRGWALGEFSGDISPEGRQPRSDALDKLAVDMRSTLRRAAVLGARFSPSLLARLEQRDEIGVLETFQAAHDAGLELVETSGDTFGFKDAELQTVLRDELLPPLRRAYATRAADILRQAQKVAPSTGLGRIHPARIAALAEQAGDLSGALAAHLDAARHDEFVLALGGAIGHLRRAHELAGLGVRAAGRETPPPWRLSATLARLLVSRPHEREGVGAADAEAERAEGLQLLTESLSLADAADGDVRERAALRTTLALALSEAPHTTEEALNQIRRARTLLVVGGLPGESWQYARHELRVLLAMDDKLAAIKAGQSALRYFRQDAADHPFAARETAHCLLTLSRIRRGQLSAPGTPEREAQRKALEAALEEARHLYKEEGDDEGRAAVMTERALVLRAFAEEKDEGEDRDRVLQQAVRLVSDAASILESGAAPDALSHTRLVHGELLSLLGRAEEAAAQFLEAGMLRLAAGEQGVGDVLDRFASLGGVAALKARTNLSVAAGLPPDGHATRVLPAFTDEDVAALLDS